jgi:transposase InsO family protein
MTALSPSERWANFRFAIIGPLLAAPPEQGELKAALETLAQKTWHHPVSGEPVTFAFATVERWFYQARAARQDPVGTLRRRRRADAGQSRRLSPALEAVVREQYRAHPGWSVQLHHDNLAVTVGEDPALGPLPSYATLRRFMRRSGFDKRPRPRATPGAIAAAVRKAEREVRSFEAAYTMALWHLDFHHGRHKVLTRSGRWVKPILFGVMDDHTRLVPHLQWYLDETAETLVHGLCQGFEKYGLPRALMTDNGAAMVAAEVREGLARLGVLHQTTLPYSPEQNAKQEAFWGTVEGRLMAMLEGCEDLTLEALNEATCAWLDRDYQRRHHRELGTSPLARFQTAKDVGRDSPASTELRCAFRTQVLRRPRRSDGTLSLAGQRFELSNRYRHLTQVAVRYARWDLSAVDLVDPQSGALLAALYPLDKARNAEGLRRRLDEPGPLPAEKPAGMAPLLKRLMADYAATGLPPAYLPKDDRNDEDKR